MSDVLNATIKPPKVSQNDHMIVHDKIMAVDMLDTQIYFSYILGLLVFKYFAKFDSINIRKFDLAYFSHFHAI